MQLQNYIITYSPKYYLEDSDVLAHGVHCKHIIKDFYKQLDANKSTSSDFMILDKIKRLYTMSLNSKESDLYITKFVNSNWGKSSFFSDIGEHFLTIDKFIEWYPYVTPVQDCFVANRSIRKKYKT